MIQDHFGGLSTTRQCIGALRDAHSGKPLPTEQPATAEARKTWMSNHDWQDLPLGGDILEYLVVIAAPTDAECVFFEPESTPTVS